MAGDADLGRRVEACRDGYVYSDAPFDLKAAVALRERQIAELTTPGQIDSKYSRGGLVDVEYTVQVLQLLHGGATSKRRIPSTLRAIEALRGAGVLDDNAAAQLTEAYRFLRRLIDAQRIVRGHARDLVLPPPESDEFLFLARRLGYWEEQDASARLAADIAAHRQCAARLYAEVFGGADTGRRIDRRSFVCGRDILNLFFQLLQAGVDIIQPVVYVNTEVRQSHGYVPGKGHSCNYDTHTRNNNPNQHP